MCSGTWTSLQLGWLGMFLLRAVWSHLGQHAIPSDERCSPARPTSILHNVLHDLEDLGKRPHKRMKQDCLQPSRADAPAFRVTCNCQGRNTRATTYLLLRGLSERQERQLNAMKTLRTCIPTFLFAILLAGNAAASGLQHGSHARKALAFGMKP